MHAFLCQLDDRMGHHSSRWLSSCAYLSTFGWNGGNVTFLLESCASSQPSQLSLKKTHKKEVSECYYLCSLSGIWLSTIN